jgi:HAD superfamily hydrolase (TIGR01509 family)
MRIRQQRLFVFDIGNVLLRFDPGRASANFNRHDPGKGDAMMRSLWDESLMDRHETGRLTGPELFALLRRRHKLSMSYKTFLADFRDIFEPVKENVALFMKLVKQEPVAILSNVGDIHWTYIRRLYPFLKAAKYPCASFKIGVMKPEKNAYIAVAEQSGVPLDKMIYIDDREEFIAAARKWGVTAIHFTGKRPLRTLLKEAGIDIKGVKNR